MAPPPGMDDPNAETGTTPAAHERGGGRGPLRGDSGGRFLPGTVVAGRYRMIGLLGRGGMGEVYRADDLKLGQPVALKFLPTDVERDPERLERFLNEVRVSLKVTHPNVCRAFDVGQIEQRHFLSMEFVDGEDLGSLLRRIGRLPEDKAVEIARQLCAGLAAAHDEGVLHRDIKPANIMIDGRGRAKITDFGLAGAFAGMSGAEARAGTPKYMAPEQIEGGTLSERTDLYALGLVLYEIFTGKTAYDVRDGEDLRRSRSSAPTSPASHVSGLDPLVERAILRCLEHDPAKRPQSAAALAAALPGGDPLAMAIAAGDTPSPEMVAAAGADVGIGSAMAWRLLVLALPAILVFALLAGRTVLTTIGAPLKSPDAMIERARDLLTSAGMRGPVADSAFGFSTTAYLNYAASGKAVAGDGGLADNAVAFWYRERPVLLERARFVGPSLLAAVAPDDPPLYYSGELMVWLDRHGRLIGARSIPRQKPTVEATTSSPEWSTFFKAAGLDEATWAAADSEWTPIAYADRRWAWVPKGSQPVPAIRIEATSVRGKPISFVLVYPWTFPDRDVGTARTSERRVGDFIAVSLLSLLMLGAAVVARRNLRLDRVDRKGAVRLGLVVASLAWIAWLLDEHHVPSIWELYLATVGIGYALFVGVLVGVFYMALEPHVRRTWPSMLVSWSRLLAGDLLNPLVARDVLIGAVVIAILGSIDLGSMQLVRSLTGVLPQLDQAPRPFMGGLHLLSAFPVDLLVTIFLCLLQLFLYFVVRRVVRFDWVAIGLCGLVMALATSVGVGATAARLPLAFLVQAATFLMLSRIGLVAFIAGSFVQSILLEFPVVWPTGMWYSPAGYLGLAVSAALVIGAFRIVMKAQGRSIPARASA